MLKHIVFIVLLVLMFMGSAGAADYYVSTSGDNGASGDLAHPWRDVSYATLQAVAGDSINLFDGTWYNEEAMFQNNGTPSAHIILTAYNGTPTLASTVATTTAIHTWYVGSFEAREYIDISDITITDYHDAIYIRQDNHITVENVTVNIRSKADGNHAGISVHDGSTHIIVDQCNILGDGWNSLGVSGRYVSGTIWSQEVSSNVSFTNNVIHANTHHNLIDIKGNVTDVDIIGNRMYDCDYNGFYTHQGSPTRVNFSNNVLYDISLNGISLYNGVDCLIQNNTITNVLYGARGYDSENTTYRGNTITTCPGNGIYHYNTSLAEGNRITDAGSMVYRFAVGMNILRSPLLAAGDRATLTSGGDVIVDNLDGQVFAISGISGANYTYVQPTWAANGGNASIITHEQDTIIFYLTNYNVTISPAGARLQNVSVAHDSTTTDDRTTLTVNSSTDTNPTWINATMQVPNCNYSASVDSVIVTHINSDADGVVRYRYTDTWSPHTFEFLYVGTDDNTKAFWCTWAPIENYVNADSYVWWNRTLTGADTPCTFALDVVV